MQPCRRDTNSRIAFANDNDYHSHLQVIQQIQELLCGAQQLLFFVKSLK